MKKLFALCLTFAMVALLFSACAKPSKEPEDRLSAEQIEKLRDEYPILGVNDPPLVDTITPKFLQVTESAETFVYGEIIGESDWFYRRSFEFFSYPVRVIEDTENKFEQSDEISIYKSILFKDSDHDPKFREGTRVIVPVVKDEEKEGFCAYWIYGMYYVTDDGYAISAFDEEATQMETSFSGIRVENLLKKLRKLK